MLKSRFQLRISLKQLSVTFSRLGSTNLQPVNQNIEENTISLRITLPQES